MVSPVGLMNFVIQRADPTQIEEIAKIFRSSRQQLLPFLPDLHSAEEDLIFFREQVFPRQNMFVVCSEGKVRGFISFGEGHLDHLYLAPPFLGRGLGKALLAKAKENEAQLELWVFQENKRAIDFYLKEGFKIVRSTDGAENEEKCPDHLMLWQAQRPSL